MKLIAYNDVLKMIKDFFDGCLPTEDRDSVARDFLDELDKIPVVSEMKWTPIDSGILPPVGTSVLTSGQKGGINMAYIKSYSASGKPCWKKHDTNRPYTPVAWMNAPLPYGVKESSRLQSN